LPLYRYLPTISIVWRWIGNLSAISLITLILTSFFIYSVGPKKSEDVWVPRGFTLLTPEVFQEGQMSYILSTEPVQSCPGLVKHTFVGGGGFDSRAPVVTIQRPLVRPGIMVKDAKFTESLPPQVTPGHWRVILSIQSQCPTYTDSDILAEFHLDVLPMANGEKHD
jgi:hypothetical protein